MRAVTPRRLYAVRHARRGRLVGIWSLGPGMARALMLCNREIQPHVAQLRCVEAGGLDEHDKGAG